MKRFAPIFYAISSLQFQEPEFRVRRMDPVEGKIYLNRVARRSQWVQVISGSALGGYIARALRLDTLNSVLITLGGAAVVRVVGKKCGLLMRRRIKKRLIKSVEKKRLARGL